jgi:hypothetical protein
LVIDVAGEGFQAWKARNAWWTCLIVGPLLLIAAVTWVGLVLAQILANPFGFARQLSAKNATANRA